MTLPTDRFWADPIRILTDAGMEPDPWQAETLSRSSSRELLLCGRQTGKSTTASALALRAAFLEAPALVLLLSPSLRQSGELLRKVLDLYGALGQPVPKLRPRDNALRLDLANGSRIISLPGIEATIRCYSGVNLIIIDEAARVPDDLYRAVRPMLAVSNGRLIALSTPFGKRGWFYDAWESTDPSWRRTKTTAEDCPRIPKAFLAEERREIGPRWYAQEYLCSFEDVVGAVFTAEVIQAATRQDLEPLWN
jgi:hypothetical protein